MNDKLYDPLRRKDVARTPEEEVRQGLIQWLNKAKGVSLNWMMSEYGFKCGPMAYRADLVIFDKHLNPVLLAECKAPTVPIDRSVIEQGLRYNQQLRVKYMLFTNGQGYRIAKLDAAENRFIFVDACPTYEEMLQE